MNWIPYREKLPVFFQAVAGTAVAIGLYLLVRQLAADYHNLHALVERAIAQDRAAQQQQAQQQHDRKAESSPAETGPKAP